jgi:ribosomal protein L27
LRPVLHRDFGVEAALMVRKGVGSVGAADDDQFGAEGAKAFDLPNLMGGLIRICCLPGGRVEQSVEGGLGDGVQVFALAAGKIEVNSQQLLR